MNIVIPLCGQGTRMRETYSHPKFAIPVWGRPLLTHVLDRLMPQLAPDDEVYIITLSEHRSLLEKTILDVLRLTKLGGHVRVIYLDTTSTRGAADTLRQGIAEMPEDRKSLPVLCMDGDTFYTTNVLQQYRQCGANAVFYTQDTGTLPLFSYITLNASHEVTSIHEKYKCSNHANTGIYAFSSTRLLGEYTSALCETASTDELYLSHVIRDMLVHSNHVFQAIHLPSHTVYNLGTPAQMQAYLDRSAVFLFDLDGTLMHTEHVYYHVWQDVLRRHGIHIDRDDFDRTVQGRSDADVLRHWLPHLDASAYPEVSAEKDAAFMETHAQVTWVEGARELLDDLYLHGQTIAVVTNSNRRAAEHLLKDVRHLLTCIVVGNECPRPKPYPDPYKLAIERLGGDASRAIVFEDSKTGILSALSVKPGRLVGIETTYDAATLRSCNVDLSVASYHDFSWRDAVAAVTCTAPGTSWGVDETALLACLTWPTAQRFTKVSVHREKRKGGFIADVLSMDVHYLDIHGWSQIQPCVLKRPNPQETFLSNMSRALNLYQRETTFYEKWSSRVPVAVPQYWGTYDGDSVCMEDLTRRGGVFDQDCSDASSTLPLRIVDELASLHRTFWRHQPDDNDLPCANSFPWMATFVYDHFPAFMMKWGDKMTAEQCQRLQRAIIEFATTQERLSQGDVTLCHGDAKSANLCFVGPEPRIYFCDWQYAHWGKGAQDLVFFLIASLPAGSPHLLPCIQQYYRAMTPHYSWFAFCEDCRRAVGFFPLFVAIWFGTLPTDELIDKTFPATFIERFLAFLTLENDLGAMSHDL